MKKKSGMLVCHMSSLKTLISMSKKKNIMIFFICLVNFFSQKKRKIQQLTTGYGEKKSLTVILKLYSCYHRSACLLNYFLEVLKKHFFQCTFTSSSKKEIIMIFLLIISIPFFQKKEKSMVIDNTSKRRKVEG